MEETKIITIITLVGVLIIFTVFFVAPYLDINNYETDTYDNWDCLNECYNIMNWTDGSHRAYADCSDMCISGEIEYK